MITLKVYEPTRVDIDICRMYWVENKPCPDHLLDVPFGTSEIAEIVGRSDSSSIRQWLMNKRFNLQKLHRRWFITGRDLWELRKEIQNIKPGRRPKKK